MDSAIKNLVENHYCIIDNKLNQDDLIKISNEFKKFSKEVLDNLANKYLFQNGIYIENLDAHKVFEQANFIFKKVEKELKNQNLSANLDTKNDDVNTSEKDLTIEKEKILNDVVSKKNESSNSNLNMLERNKNKNETNNNKNSNVNNNFPLVKDFDSEHKKKKFENLLPEKTVEILKENPQKKKDFHELNDDFFDLDEYQKQVLKLENDNEIDEEDINYYDEVPLEDIVSPTYYQDFFLNESNLKHRQNLQDQIEENEINEDQNIDIDVENKEELQSEIDSNELEESSSEIDYENDESDCNQKQIENESFNFENQDNKNTIDDDITKIKKFKKDIFENGEDNDTKLLSNFEKQQQKIKREIELLEAESVEKKKWFLTGEASVKNRPFDSIINDLEPHNLNFDYVAKQNVLESHESIDSIETIIKKRILNNNFDDLEKRLVLNLASENLKQKIEVSVEKSTKSLTELYENEYKNEKPQDEFDKQLLIKHNEIKTMFDSLSYKLDFLSSPCFIYKPKEFKKIEVKQNDNESFLNTEETHHIDIVNKSKLAPQEVFKANDKNVKPVDQIDESQIVLKSGLSISKNELSHKEKLKLKRKQKKLKSKDLKKKKELKDLVNIQSSSKKKNLDIKKAENNMDVILKSKNISVVNKGGELTKLRHNKKQQKIISSFNLKN